MKLLALLLSLPLAAFAADPALTIYNQNFAVVRETLPLSLKEGANDVKFSNITTQLEPSSVILRDPTGKTSLQILEQNFRNDPVSQGLMLSLFEGQEIDFAVNEPQKPDRIVRGKVIRSGYPASDSNESLIEVDGKLQFQLPGLPIFPALADQTILKPELSWKLHSSREGAVNAELGYVTSGLSWSADYNIVSQIKSDVIDIIGWVTMNNTSGMTFTDARIKLMAGDVNRIQPEPVATGRRYKMAMADAAPAPAVTEKAFDEFHLYSLPAKTTLRDQETKQVEFIRATGVKAERIYVYDGFDLGPYRGWNSQALRTNEEIGSESQGKVAVMREFKNSEANHLGMPLPAGRLRFYQQDDDGQLEFTGENTIDHTPKDETIRVTTGNAFDLTGERKRTDFKVDNAEHWAQETIEIKVRNHKTEPVEIRVVEHLYRWINWTLTDKSMDFQKLNAQEIEFRVPLKPDEEKTVTYTVKYSW